MGVTVRLDEARWQAHLDAVVADAEAIVPVVKGHGYGFGLVRLAAECRRLGLDTIAVGMASEVGVVRGTFDGDGDVVVLQPYEQGDGGLADGTQPQRADGDAELGPRHDERDVLHGAQRGAGGS